MTAAIQPIRLIRLLRLGIWRNSVQWWSLRAFVITLVIGQAVTPLLGLLVWSSALPGNAGITSYYVVLLAVQLLTVSYEHHTLANEIYGGEFAAELVKPRPVVIDLLATNLAIRLWHLLFGLPLIVLVGLLASVDLTWRQLLLALPAVVLAASIRFVFTYTLALSAIWTQRAHGAVGIGETLIFLLGGTAAPLTFLPGSLQEAGRLLPFWSMLGAPAEIAAGNLSTSGAVATYGVQAAWLVVLTALAAVVWRLGVRRFTAVGG
ncbi:ABC-2 family transporter protein [Kribbella sp. NPDC051620]|uniref:ABC-2 family transporter protein n=1 Tax=Kribbella sp. NPDC051620 TaxID=3364120 RepID=UPI0037BCFF28